MNITAVNRDGNDYGPLEIEVGQNYTFAYAVTVADVPVPLTSGVVTIRKGSTIFVDAAAVDVTGNQFSYEYLATAHPDEPDEMLIIEFTITPDAGSPFDSRELFDLVRVPLRVPIVEADLFQSYHQLRENRILGFEEGFAKASSTDTALIAVELTQYPDGFYDRGEVEIIAGTNRGDWRRVTTFDGVAGEATLEVAFNAPLDDTSNFRIRRSWEPTIAEAWASMKRRLSNRSREFGFIRAALVMDAYAFRESLIDIAAGRAFGSMQTGEQDDPATLMADKLSKSGWDLFNGVKLIYDTTDDGDPNTVVKAHAIHVARR